MLCDVLHYTRERFKPKAMIDLATLTGAVIVALGHEQAGLFANDETLAAELIAAGGRHRRAALAPAARQGLREAHQVRHRRHQECRARARGRAARLGRCSCSSSSATRPGRISTSPAMAWSSRDLPLSGKGATGFGVRLLDRLVADKYEAGRLTEVGFYHLTRSTLEEALPRLLEKAYAGGSRVVVRVGDRRAAGAAQPCLVDLRQGLLPAARHARRWLSRGPADLSDHRGREPERCVDPGAGRRCRGAGPGLIRPRASTCSTAAIRMRSSRRAPALARGAAAAGHGCIYWQQAERGGWVKAR